MIYSDLDAVGSAVLLTTLSTASTVQADLESYRYIHIELWSGGSGSVRDTVIYPVSAIKNEVRFNLGNARLESYIFADIYLTLSSVQLAFKDNAGWSWGSVKVYGIH